MTRFERRGWRYEAWIFGFLVLLLLRDAFAWTGDNGSPVQGCLYVRLPCCLAVVFEAQDYWRRHCQHKYVVTIPACRRSSGAALSRDKWAPSCSCLTAMKWWLFLKRHIQSLTTPNLLRTQSPPPHTHRSPSKQQSHLPSCAIVKAAVRSLRLCNHFTFVSAIDFLACEGKERMSEWVGSGGGRGRSKQREATGKSEDVQCQAHILSPWQQTSLHRSST